MYPDDPSELANHIAETITARIGRIWDEDAQQRLSAWLGEPEHQPLAIQWLNYMDSAEEADFDPVKEFILRRPIYEALTGKSAVTGTGGGTGGTVLVSRWSRRRRKPPRSTNTSR